MIILVSAVIRGSYHLYQGFGGFVGNLIMGVIFGLIYLRWKRVGPLMVAHTLLDIAAFVGYALVAPSAGSRLALTSAQLLVIKLRAKNRRFAGRSARRRTR